MVKRFTFMTLFEKSIANKKTQRLWYAWLERQPYKTSLDPAYACCVFRARISMFEIKANFKNKYDSDPSCPFCKIEDETFDHIFTCESGLLCKNSLNNNSLLKLSHNSHNGYLQDTGDPGEGGLPYVGYTGMCHRPESIFHFQKIQNRPQILKFYSRTGPTFWSFTPEQALPFEVLLQNRILFWQFGLKRLAQMSKSQLLTAFVSCSLMSSLLFYYAWASVSSFL